MSQPQICLHDLIDFILRGQLAEEEEEREEEEEEEETVKTQRTKRAATTTKIVNRTLTLAQQ